MAISWQTQAKAVAETFGVVVYFGVRPKGDWFAHVDGIEWDGSTPGQALRAVMKDLIKRTESQSKAAQGSAALAATKLEALAATTAALKGEDLGQG